MELEVTQPPSGPDAPATETAQTDTSVALTQPQDTQQVDQQTPPAQTDTQQTDQETQEQTGDEAVSKFVQDAGFDPAELSRQIATSGDIPVEAKKALAEKLEKVGLPGSMVDEYISGQKAVMASTVQDIMSVAGGQEGYQKMAEWASQNLSEAELKAYSDIMTKADVNTAKLTVGNLYARFKSNVPSTGQRVKGNTGTTGGDVFRSWEQQKEAQRDPRYKTDAAFRADVEAKIERTLLAGGYKHDSR